MTDTTETAPAQASLSDLRMPELQALANRMGISGISKMRKNDLVEAIRERRRSNGQRRTTSPDTPAEADRPESARAEQTGSGQASGRSQAKGKTRAPAKSGQPRSKNASARGEGQSPQRAPEAKTGRGGRSAAVGQDSAAAKQDNTSAGQDGADPKTVSLDEIIQFPEPAERPKDDAGRGARRATRGQGNAEPNRDTPEDGDGDDERSGRRRRGRDRYRDRKRRQTGRDGGGADEPEILEDDVLIPVAGILDVLENYAFVRTSGYLPGASDVYVSLGQVKKSGLRRGDAIAGAVRQPREGETQRQKFNALVRLDSVNGAPVEDAQARPEFDALIPMYPDERLTLETTARQLTGRAIDIVAPMGKGQRSLILAPPRSGRTQTLLEMAGAITANHPEAHLMAVLIDQRPEEVTQWQRQVAGEVVASTFDRPASDHTSVSELAIERAKRLVELGQDVVVLLDSLTGLSRAYNAATPAGRASAPVDSAALHPAKAFFGAARNIENGGSLTIVATARVDSGSLVDELILEEFFGTENCEVRLVRDGADSRHPALVDPQASGTRREDLLLTPDELSVTGKVRRILEGMDAQSATQTLLGRLGQSGSNAEFLLAVNRAAAGDLA